MKVAVAQTRPVKGDVQRNIDNHKKIIGLAVARGVNTIIFPELSLTGYEPALAKKLATNQEDSRFDDFQLISDAGNITIGVGMPTRSNDGICISMLIFHPQKARQTYSKKFIHADEEAFFVSGQGTIGLIGDRGKIAVAICYELSIPAHSETAFKSGAEIYIASVAKTASGVEKASTILSEIAGRFSMTVLMSNCIGPCDDFVSGGKTTSWNNEGILMEQLDESNEGIIIIDTDTVETIKITL